MELDWTTFFLEIANFLVLVWILQRFLYAPVRAVIARRQETVARQLDEARTAQAQAAELKGRYENRLAEWNAEREKLGAALTAELEAERARRMKALDKELEQESARRRAVEARREEDMRRTLEEQALAEAGRFASRLFARLASNVLEDGIVGLVLDDLRTLSDDRRQSLRNGVATRTTRIAVTTAYPLSQERRAALGAALRDLVGEGMAIDFGEDPALGAGLRVALGPWVLRANLRDELGYFAEASRGTADS